jgi:hypothetical protein
MDEWISWYTDRECAHISLIADEEITGRTNEFPEMLLVVNI